MSFRIRPNVQPNPAPARAHAPGVPLAQPSVGSAAPWQCGPTGPQGLMGESVEGVGVSQVLFENNVLSFLLTDGSEYGFNLQDLLLEHVQTLQGPPGPTGPAAPPAATEGIWLKLGNLEARVAALEKASGVIVEAAETPADA